MEDQTILSIGISLVCVVLVSVSWGILDWVWFKPKRLEKCLRNQGFNGNSYRLLYGDTNERARMTMESRLNPMPNLSNDFLPHSLAFFHHIITKYGRNCFIWNGPIPLVNIVEPYLIREIFMKINDFQKAKSNPLIKKVAPGLVFLEGHAWAQRRKLLTPAFHIDKLKFMIPAMWESLNEMIKEWEDLTSKRGSCEIEVWSSLQKLSADMISRAAFGSSYQEGKTIFDLITQQIKIVIPVFNSVYIPGWRFLPTKTNRKISEIDREIRNRLKDIIDKRKKSINTKEREKDNLLSTLIQDNFGHANKKQDIKKLSIEEVVNECKLFYLAGQDTTSSLLLWTLIMLGKHQIWQQRAREEIINAFGDGKPQFHELNHLKIVNMILQEVLRLYPPILELNREVTQDIKIGDVILPTGVLLNIPILLLQQDEKIWGQDAKEFNPERFSEGISKASKGNMSFFAFGWGPRICLGSNFAMVEAKLTLVFILQSCRFLSLGRPLSSRRLFDRTLLYGLLHGDTKDRAKMTMEATSKPMPNLSNDFLPHTLAFFHHTISKFGRKCMVWNGPVPLVSIAEPDLVREVFMKINQYQKPKSNPIANKVISGLIVLEGNAWTHRRKLLTPAFHFDKLKFMVPAIWESSKVMIEEWEELVSKTGSCEIEVWSSLQKLSADMISRAAFGSSYQEGKTIFDLITQQIKIAIPIFNSVYIPGFRFLPTKRNRRITQIDIEIKNLLKGIIDKRKKAMKTQEKTKDDLLNTLLESSYEQEENGHGNKKKDIHLNIEEILGECKLFYLAGQDTTSSLLVWTLIMLAKHQIWQQLARQEIFNAFGDKIPQFHELNHLKIVNMILQEVLRLYPPVTETNREVIQDTKIGNMILPAGVLVNIPILLMQHDENIWGKDAKEFNPERFSEGISKASKGNMSFFAFGWGPRICIGSNFAMIEAKLTLVCILQRFVFELSPSYLHAPSAIGSLRPQFGAPIIFRPRILGL